MDKGKLLKMVKTIVFIVGFSLFQFLLLWNLRNQSDSAWPQIAKIVLGLIFWLVLWQLSCSNYERNRGIGRWVRPSGLMKAFLILSISIGLSTWALRTYIDTTVTQPLNEMGRISIAMEDFYFDYKTYPGKPGEIASDMQDELKGTANAKINVKHIDYLAQENVKSLKDRWGHPYRFRIDHLDPTRPDLSSATIISCGPNGIFEDGKGDDLTFP